MMRKIIIAGHGSPRDEANNIQQLSELLHRMIHPDCSDKCVIAAYLQFAQPDIMQAISECVKDGVKQIIIHPYFLSSGLHVTRDIPEVIKEAEKKYPDVKFIYTEPLGIHTKIAQAVLDRIYAASNLTPDKIEKRSFEIIAEEVDFKDVSKEKQPVVKRVIHATADFEFKNSLVFHQDAIKTGIAAIKAGRDILTDVEMIRAGIDKRLLKKWGGKVVCKIQDSKFKIQNNKTRAEMGIEEALKENNKIGIIAIGNAPTALLKTIEILKSIDYRSKTRSHDILVIGVPVGFVKAVESKTLLARQEFPYITNLSRKGGSTVAVAIVNALLKMAKGGDSMK
jgi:precorrin-8X/cobalt-precorrin-8 methylmutase